MTPTDKPMTVDALMKLVNRYAEACDDLGADLFAQDATKHAALRAAAAGAYAQIRADIEQYGREREALGARWNITDEMVSRFLRWRLPDDFAPDGGILFKRVYNEASLSGPKNHEPTGTNLFSGEQARKMLEHVLEGEPKISVDLGWRKECDDIDAVLKHIGLDLEQCRTDGGFLNVPRIKTLLAEREAAGRGSGEPVADQDHRAIVEFFTLNPSAAKLAWDRYTAPQPRAPLTDEQIDRHTLLAQECPPGSKVILVSSLRRLRAHGIRSEG